MSDMTRREFLQTGAAGSAMLMTGGLNAGDARAQLPQRMLGKTGVSVPVLGLGTVSVGSMPNEKDALAFINKCIDVGVTYIDTAPGRSGYGRAHSYLKTVLKDRRKEVFLATKCLEPDGSKALAFLKKNLEELGVEQVDLIYSHSIGHSVYSVDGLTANGGTMSVLEQAKKDGLARFVGVTGHNRPEKFVEAITNRPIDAMMNAVNVVDRHTYWFEEVVWPTARKQNIGLIAMKVYGGGITACKMPEDLKHASFRYALSVPGVALAVIGMYKDEELAQNIEWAKNFKPMSAEEAKELKAKTVELAKKWGTHLDQLDRQGLEMKGEKSRPLVNT